MTAMLRGKEEIPVQTIELAMQIITFVSLKERYQIAAWV